MPPRSCAAGPRDRLRDTHATGRGSRAVSHARRSGARVVPNAGRHAARRSPTSPASTGQPAPETPGQFVRCCLESLALAYRDKLATLESILDRRFDVIHVVGGGGKNELLCQMTADATGRRVVVGPYEATAIGNALVQAMAAGDVRDLAELRKIVARSFELVNYEPADTQRLGPRLPSVSQGQLAGLSPPMQSAFAGRVAEHVALVSTLRPSPLAGLPTRTFRVHFPQSPAAPHFAAAAATRAAATLPRRPQ